MYCKKTYYYVVLSTGVVAVNMPELTNTESPMPDLTNTLNLKLHTRNLPSQNLIPIQRPRKLIHTPLLFYSYFAFKSFHTNSNLNKFKFVSHATRSCHWSFCPHTNSSFDPNHITISNGKCICDYHTCFL